MDTKTPNELVDNPPPEPMVRRKKVGYFPELVGSLSSIHLEGISADDPLAYATGYVTGKTGSPKDPVFEGVDIPDYDLGWELGQKVFMGAERPEWDRSPGSGATVTA